MSTVIPDPEAPQTRGINEKGDLVYAMWAKPLDRPDAESRFVGWVMDLKMINFVKFEEQD